VSAARYLPDRAAFTDLAATAAVVPVRREVLADLVTPVSVYERLRAWTDGPSFLLESVERGERWGRWSFVGLDPLASLTAAGDEVTVTGPAFVVEAAVGAPDVLAALDTVLAALRGPEPVGADLPPLHGGAVGYLGWDVVRAVERIPPVAVDDLGLDDVRLIFPTHVVAFDHLRQVLVVVTNVVVGDDPDADYDAALEACERLVARLAEPLATPAVEPPRAVQVDDAASNTTRDAFLDAVRRAQEHIQAGDVFQVVPSQRFALRTDVDPLLVYRVLRVLNPSPYMYAFDWGDLQIVGSSPEALVTVRDGGAQIWPIAGSRRRGADDAEDRSLEAELRADAKERAEHVMLVDLARNDLGRVCEVGSVAVTDFMDVVRYSHVMHLVSRVSGRVRPDAGVVDVVRATFPAGTLSGAPKVRALQLIEELEPTRRGPYGGGIGYVDLAGRADLCITIRTLVFSGGTAYVQAGAGVVADSDPAAEYDESVAKAMAALSAVRAAEAMTEPAASRPAVRA